MTAKPFLDLLDEIGPAKKRKLKTDQSNNNRSIKPEDDGVTNQSQLRAGYGAALVDREGSTGIAFGKLVLLLGIVDVCHTIPVTRAEKLLTKQHRIQSKRAKRESSKLIL